MISATIVNTRWVAIALQRRHDSPVSPAVIAPFPGYLRLLCRERRHPLDGLLRQMRTFTRFPFLDAVNHPVRERAAVRSIAAGDRPRDAHELRFGLGGAGAHARI